MTTDQKKLVDEARMAVIVKCIQLNYAESGKWAEKPENEIIAVMAKSIFDLTDIPARDMRPYFIEVAKWKAQNEKIPIVTAYDLLNAREKWSQSYISIPRQRCAILPDLSDVSLASLPQVQRLKHELNNNKQIARG